MKPPLHSILALAPSLTCAAPALAGPDEKLKAVEAAQPALIRAVHR